MRYIYIVIGLILISLGITGITFFKSSPSSRELVGVNERSITIAEFEGTYRESCAVNPMPVDKGLFLDNLITKEILIQEAKRLGLDLKEPFRRSIQSYYEQTLLKNLTQEKMSELKVSVSEEEILSYYENMGKVYGLRVVTLPTEREASEAIKNFPFEKNDKKLLHMDEIPFEMLDEIMTLKVGEVYKKPVPRERGFYVFKLEGYKMEPVPPLTEVHDEIKKTLTDKKKRSEMEKWLEGLKKKSRIKINEELLKKEG